MITLTENDNVVFFDVDHTLIDFVSNTDPDAENALFVSDGIQSGELVRPIEVHVEALKEHYRKGHQVIVWSQQGSTWAENVVRALDLQFYVDLVLTKPTAYYDDLAKDDWGVRIYKV